MCSVYQLFQKSVDIYQTIIAIKAQHIKCAKPNFNAIILKEVSYAPVNLTCRIAVMVYFMVFAYKSYHFRRQIRGKCKSRNSMYTSKVYLNYRFEFDRISRYMYMLSTIEAWSNNVHLPIKLSCSCRFCSDSGPIKASVGIRVMIFPLNFKSCKIKNE